MSELGTLTCGVDIGARTIGVALCRAARASAVPAGSPNGDGASVVASLVVDTGPRPRENAEEAYARLLDRAGTRRGDLARTVSTGYGRNHFEPADRTASEIVCHAAGVAHLFPAAECVVDIGGQDSKAIELGAGGKVLGFAMNDRCAAGTGRFIEMVAQILGISLDEAGALALEGEGACEINSMCAVFAETEIVGLLQSGSAPDAILRGVYRSVAKRTISLMGRAAACKEIVFTGGVARNPGVVEALKAQTGRAVIVPEDPQTTGALGAAIIAARET
ncbi:MAG: acyl-CoA dehydratase activase [Planctomycetota bacterium]|jgi:predicted CoA-substrate-specific enzyme activase